MSIPESLPKQDKIRITPAARELAERAGIALSMVAGTGPDNQIEVADVEAVLSKKRQTKPLSPSMLPPESAVQPTTNAGMDSAEKAKIQAAREKRRTQALQQVAPPPTTAETAPAPAKSIPKIVKLTEQQQAIGSQLQRSIQTVPQGFLEVQVNASGIETLQVGESKPTITSILIKACAWALQRNPWLNATFHAERSGEIALWPSVNIGFVIVTEGRSVIPVIHQAERLPFREIHEKVNTLTERAHKNSLTADELADATFTISDMGVFDVDRATEIILPPQVAILAAGRISKQVAIGADDRPVLRPTINLTLSVDQRAVNSALAAAFLADLRRVLENPSLLE